MGRRTESVWPQLPDHALRRNPGRCTHHGVPSYGGYPLAPHGFSTLLGQLRSRPFRLRDGRAPQVRRANPISRAAGIFLGRDSRSIGATGAAVMAPRTIDMELTVDGKPSAASRLPYHPDWMMRKQGYTMNPANCIHHRKTFKTYWVCSGLR